MNDTWPPPPERREPQFESAPPVDKGHTFWRWLFAPRDESSRWSIIVWWEKRRLAYNAIVGGVGLICLMLFLVVMSSPKMTAPGEDAVEPFAVMLAPIAANFCYTAGWIFELAVSLLGEENSRKLGPTLLKVGLVFSLIVVAIPPVVALARLIVL